MAKEFEIVDCWQPFKTIPQDGSVVVVYAEIWNYNPRKLCGWFVTTAYMAHGIWQSGNFSVIGKITHWMPLPNAPRAARPKRKAVKRGK